MFPFVEEGQNEKAENERKMTRKKERDKATGQECKISVNTDHMVQYAHTLYKNPYTHRGILVSPPGDIILTRRLLKQDPVW